MLAVASSRMRILGFRSNARAMQISFCLFEFDFYL